MMYVQCQLVKDNRHTVSFIPEHFAKKDGVVKLKNDGIWEDGWVVVNTGGKVHESAIVEMRDRYKHHRKGTDI